MVVEVNPEFAANWLARARAHMTCEQALVEKMLIGKLYNAMERKADESPNGLVDPDVRALGEAYVQAIDHGKHGDDILLPQHLRTELGLDAASPQTSSARKSAPKPVADGFLAGSGAHERPMCGMIVFSY